MDEKRKYCRVSLSNTLISRLRILSDETKKIDKLITHVEITDISVGGLSFKSKTNLPNNTRIIYEFAIVLNSKTYNIRANIVRKTLCGDKYSYGVQFYTTSYLRDLLSPGLLKLKNLDSANIMNEHLFEYYHPHREKLEEISWFRYYLNDWAYNEKIDSNKTKKESVRLANWKRKYWKLRKDFKAELYEEVKNNIVYIPMIMETYTASKHRTHIHKIWSMMRNHKSFKDEYTNSKMMGSMIAGRDEILSNLAFIDKEKFMRYMSLIPEKLAMGDAVSIAYRVQGENRKK